MEKVPLSVIKRLKRLQELDRPLTLEEKDEMNRILDYWDRLNMANAAALRPSEGKA